MRCFLSSSRQDGSTRLTASYIILLTLVPLHLLACGEETEAPVQIYELPFGPSQTALSEDVVSDFADSSDDYSDDSSDVPIEDLPPDTPPPYIQDGMACDTDWSCYSGVCLSPEEGFPGGLCSPQPCSALVPCIGDDVICYQPPSGNAFCGIKCDGDSQCREQYICEYFEDFGFGACIPEPPQVDLPDGEACTEDAQCRGGTCLQPPQFPSGYCTTLNCEDYTDCATDIEENVCLIVNTGGTNYCVRYCESASDCRAQYICQPVTDGDSYCAPDPDLPIGVDTDASPLSFTCDAFNIDFTTSRFSFNVAETSTSYMAVPVALDGRRVLPLQIRPPEPEVPIDFTSSRNGEQAFTALLLGFTSPVVIPWLPELDYQFVTGNHDYDIDTTSSSLCYYILEESGVGDTLDLNIYLVGVPGVYAAIAEGDINLRGMINEMDNIFETVGVQIGEVRYFDPDDETLEAFQIIKGDSDVMDLAATSIEPGETLNEQLSMNIFLTAGFDMGGAIGVSPGLPGPAGLHGTTGSGVVATGASLGSASGNIFTAQVVSHEIGHWLGLQHTSEFSLTGFDPLDDTPECTDMDNMDSCPDFNNLMFPSAGSNHNILTEGQGFMIQANPLTKY
jgi:hypothetical protein